MRVLVVEYIVALGLDAPLLLDGYLMLKHVVEVLHPDLEVLTPCSIKLYQRLTLPKSAVVQVDLRSDYELADVISRLSREVDLAIIIAPPETLPMLVKSCCCPVYAPSPKYVELFSDKCASARFFHELGLRKPESYEVSAVEDLERLCVDDVVLKEPYSTGCEGDYYAGTRQNCLSIGKRILSSRGRVLMQRYVRGIPASLAIFRLQDGSTIYFVSKQLVCRRGEHFLFRGVTSPVSISEDVQTRLSEVIEKLTPVLDTCDSGCYVNVDLVVTKQEVYVLEVNPRISISFAALVHALGKDNMRKLMLSHHVELSARASVVLLREDHVHSLSTRSAVVEIVQIEGVRDYYRIIKLNRVVHMRALSV